MGYRHKIGLMDRSRHDEIKGMTFSQIQKWYGDEYVPIYKITNEIYELGKYYDDSFLESKKISVFDRQEVNEIFNDEQDFYLIDKDGFKAIILDYKQKVVDHFKELLSETKDDANAILGRTMTPKAHIKSKLQEWENDYNILPFNLSLEKDTIVSSWCYEYAIFELVRIYKSVDWSKQVVTITAW